MAEKSTPMLEHLRNIQSLRGFLKSEMTMDTAENGKVLATIKVHNDAPSSPDGGDVVFVGVGLRITAVSSRGRIPHKSAMRQSRPSDPDESRKRYREGTWFGGDGHRFPAITPDEASHGEVLFPVESITYEMTTTEADLPYLDIQIEGSVSRRHLFHICQPMAALKTLAHPLVVQALRALDAIDFYGPLFAIRDAIPAFGPQTTLAEIGAFKVAVEKARDHMKQHDNDLGKLRSLAPDQKVHDHIRVLGKGLLTSAMNVCDEALEAISSNDTEKMKHSAEQINALLIQAEDVKRGQAELMSEFGMDAK